MSTKYEITISFVDDSYWSDNQRWATCKLDCESLETLNDFLATYMKIPYQFQGRDAIVLQTIDPKHVTVIKRETFDIYTLPCLQTFALEEVRKQLYDIARYGGDLTKLENRTKDSLKWTREKFLCEWNIAVKNAASIS